MIDRFARPWRVVLAPMVALVGLLMLVVACGDDNGEATPTATVPVPTATSPAEATETSAPTEPPATPTAEATEPATPTATEEPPPATGEVIESSIANFSLESLTVQVGDTVVWRNDDSAPHTSTAGDGTWDSQNLGAGDTFEHTFTSAGTFEYFCAVHPTMTGTVEVQ